MGTGASMRHMQQMNMTAAKATYTGCLKSRNHGETYVLTAANRPSPKSTRKSATLILTSASVDLRKYVDREVSVSGCASTAHKASMAMMGNETSTFTVKTLKVVAASCSWSCTR
jgi:hypothetical protein